MTETIKNLLERASCRAFLPEHVDSAELDMIVQTGLKAPSGKNMQTPRFVVVTNDETVKKLSAMNASVLGTNTDPFYGARDVIVVLAAKDGTNYLYDGALSVGNMLNAAHSLGLSARWINRAREIFYTEEGKALLKEWGIAEEVEGISFCVVGKAAEAAEIKPVVPGRVYYVR